MESQKATQIDKKQQTGAILQRRKVWYHTMKYYITKERSSYVDDLFKYA